MSGIFESIVVWMMELVQLFLLAGVVLRQSFCQKIFRYVLSVVLVVGCCVGSAFFVENSIPIQIAGTCVLFLVLLKGKRRHRFLVFLTVVWFLGYLNCFCSVVFSFISGRICYIYFLKYPEIIFQNLLSILVILLLGYLGYRINRNFFRTVPESFYKAAAAGGMCLYFILMPALELRKQYSNRIVQNFVVFGITLSILLFYLVLIAFFTANQRRLHYKNESKLKEDLLQASKEYCREILDNEKEIRKIRHDMRAHLTAIRYFAEQKKYQELEKYLLELNEQIENQGKLKSWSGNELLDAILTKYIVREDSICFDIECDHSEIGMSDYDICTLFSNVISNAVEACHKLTVTDKKIEIRIKTVQDNVVILIRNPIEKRIKPEAQTWTARVTTKKDKLNHGFGIEIIRELIQKKGGSIDFWEMENWFSVNIILPKKSVFENM